MRAHIDADAKSGLVHCVIGTAANVNEVTQASARVQGEESGVLADAGSLAVAMREEPHGIKTNRHVAMRPGRCVASDKATPMGAVIDKLEHEVRHPGQGRSHVSGDQAPVQAWRGALPQAEDGYGATAHAIRASQALDSESLTFVYGAEMSESATRRLGQRSAGTSDKPGLAKLKSFRTGAATSCRKIHIHSELRYADFELYPQCNPVISILSMHKSGAAFEAFVEQPLAQVLNIFAGVQQKPSILNWLFYMST